MTFSAAQIAAIRQPVQRARWFLGIYDPPVTLACQVNDGSIAKGTRLITYDNITEGEYGFVKQDMTMYVGSTEGAHDMGRIRVESITSTVITVAENDDIEWADDLYLTVVGFWEPFAIYPRMVYDEDADEVTWYKRYDLLYTDQNLHPPPVPCMGGHFAGFIDHPSGVWFDGSQSYDLMDEALTYQWAFPSGTPATSSDVTPGYVQYGQAGHYVAQLTVQNVSGKSYTGYRHVMLFDRPNEGPARPYTDVEFVTDVVGSVDAGGFEAEFRVGVANEDVAAQKIRNGALCIVFADEWFEGAKQSYGQHQGREHIVFVGYLVEDSMQYSYLRDQVSFKALSPLRVFANRDSFSVALDYTSVNPTDWYEMYEMNVDRAVAHYLMWHTTLYRLADTTRTGDTKLVQYANFGRQSVLNSLRTWLQGTIFADAVSDAQGYICMYMDQNLLELGSRSSDAHMTLLPCDWLNPAQVPNFWDRVVSQVELGGVYYWGPNIEEDFEPLLAVAPGDSPSYSGLSQARTGFVISGQSQLNALVGQLHAKLNNPFRALTLPLQGNYRCLPLVPQVRLTFDPGSGRDVRGNKWNQQNYFIDQISHKLASGRCLSTITLSAETDGPPGETIVIPEQPEWTPIPPGEWPPLPIPPEEPLPVSGGDGLGTVYVATDSELGRTRNFDRVGGASWEDIKGSIAGTIVDFILDPWDPINKAYCFTHGGASSTTTGLWKTVSLNSDSPVWTLMYSIDDFESNLGANVLDQPYCKLMCSINVQDYIAIIMPDDVKDMHCWHSHDAADTWSYSQISVAGGNYAYAFWRGCADIVPHLVNGNIRLWVGVPDCGSLYTHLRAYYSPDGGHTWTYHGLIGGGSHTSNMYYHVMHCPYHENEAGGKVLAGANFGGTMDYVMRSYDSSSWTNITPENGERFKYPPTSPFHRHPVESHTYNNERLCAVSTNHYNAMVLVWISDNEGASWEMLSGPAGSVPYAAGGFPYNNQLFYVLTTSGIFYSLDRGQTWHNATGDWATVMGTAWADGRIIVPVWV